jgi:hypothetical protein
MADPQTIQPLRFDPTFEQIPVDEAETTQGLVDTLRSIIETTYPQTHILGETFYMGVPFLTDPITQN